jgi:hypothetical protein
VGGVETIGVHRNALFPDDDAMMLGRAAGWGV